MGHILYKEQPIVLDISEDDERTTVRAFLGDEEIGVVVFDIYSSEHFLETEAETIREDLGDDSICAEMDYAEEVCRNKSVAYYLEWLKIEKPYRNSGYGRLLMDTAMHLILEASKSDMEDVFMYLGSCSFDTGGDGAFGNDALDKFYEKSGFKPLYDHGGGNTLMMITDMNSVVIKNDIAILESDILASPSIFSSLSEQVSDEIEHITARSPLS